MKKEKKKHRLGLESEPQGPISKSISQGISQFPGQDNKMVNEHSLNYNLSPLR